MPRSSPLRKFGPLLALGGVQLVLVLLVPSVAPGAVADTFAPSSVGLGAGVGVGDQGGGVGTPGSAVAGGAPGTVGPGGVVRTGVAGGPAGTAGRAALPAGLSPEAAKQLGDTTHCVADRQFDPAIDYFAPPCVPGIPGAAYPGDNGGATSQGVTATTVEIVTYIPDYGAEVDTILKAQGLYYTAAEVDIVNASYQKFLNEHYNFSGRKVHLSTYQGTCSTVPPDYQCLNGEMDKMVATRHPYAVVFSTTLCSACYAELARLKVISTGGAGFSDAFRSANAPYIYDQGMSSTRIEQQFAELWCRQMTSRNGSGRVASFAGSGNPAQDFRGKPRVLGVVATNDPDIQATVKNVLYPALEKGCGEQITHDYFYANDISTATQQSNAGTAAMNTSNNPATSVLCLCDPVAPQFTYNAYATNNYWPEPLIASNQAMDTDSSSQTYVDNNGAASLSCPNPTVGCPFDGAIGIGQAASDVAPTDMPAIKVFSLNSGGATSSIAPLALQIFWDNYQMLASLIENTGPALTPARMQAAAPSMGMRGGLETGHALRGFAPGQWTWTRDVRIIYFNKHKTSLYNGKPGAWVQIEGGRKDFGQFAGFTSPPAPAANARR